MIFKMKNISCLFFIILFSLNVYAQEQRALLIGIDQYAPPAGIMPYANSGRIDFPNLEGCKNDVLSVQSVIVSKFNFSDKNIDTLFDNSATRDGILNAMKKLMESSKPGDIAFIYYAGHGSLVKNSLSFEADKMDQSIVPSNTWQEGVKDIRDKELSKIFNAFLDKKIRLTVIFDCCHSGSISRGPNDYPGKTRFMPITNWDSKDPDQFAIPETREGNDFLIFSAAQSDEFADEQKDEKGMPHGAFTVALLEALNQLPVDAGALDIFTSARAILKSNGKKQEPVIGGKTERLQQTLFGISKGKIPDYTMVAVSKVMGKQIQLQGGFALGLLKENELCMFNDEKDTLFKIKIDTVTGINRCLASVIKGNIGDIKPGNQFRVTNWVSARLPLIKIFIPVSTLSETDINKFTETVKELKSSTKIKWLDVIGKGNTDPYASIFWKNNKCYIKIDTADAREIKDPSPKNILAYCKKDSTLYVELPVSKSNASQIYTRLKENIGLELVNERGSAHYTLFGRLGSKGIPAYGFRKKEVAAKDSLESMPVQTDCFELLPGQIDQQKKMTENLFKAALKLSKLRGWLNITVPDATKKGFGYHLELFDEGKKQTVLNGQYRIGHKLSMKLVADKDFTSRAGSAKYVYVFAIDQSGAMGLFYPEEDGNVSNKFPKYENEKPVSEIRLRSWEVPVPSGTDNYFLLASEEPIANPGQVFNQEGVYSGIGTRGLSGSNPLLDLLDMGNDGSRGIILKTPGTWSIQRYSYRCTY